MNEDILIGAVGSDAENPYPRILYEELKKRGFVVQKASTSRFGLIRWILISRGKRLSRILYLQWIAYLFQKTMITSIVKSIWFLSLLMAARCFGSRIIWTFHNESSHENRHRWLEMIVQRMLSMIVHRIIVLNGVGRQIVGNRFSAQAVKKIRVLPHPTYESVYGPSISREDARKKLDIDAEKTLFLFFGRIMPYKGITRLLASFASIDSVNVQLLIAGKQADLELSRYIEKAAEQDPLIEVWGQVPDDLVSTLFCAADWVVLPYERILNSGVAFLALTYERPIIATRLPSIEASFSLDGNHAGIFYNPKDAQGLERALKEALEASHQILELYGQRIREIRARSSISSIGDTLEQICRELV